MQPYQEASEELIARGERPRKALKQLGQLGVSVAAGSSIINRILPLLSKYIPPEIAEKGLNKINPNFGKFIKRSLMSGNTFDQAREFIKNKIKPEEELPEMAINDEEAGFEQPKQKKQPLAQGLQEDLDKQYGNKGAGLKKGLASMASGISDSFFKQALSSLKKRTTILSGVNDPFLQFAKPYFDQGQIQDVEELKQLYEMYAQKKQAGGQKPALQQDREQQPGKGQQALMQSMQQLTQLLGNRK